MLVMCRPSRSDRRMEPSFALGLPMFVQYRYPDATSATSPSGIFLPTSHMVFRSEPSGLADSTRPADASRKKRRPGSVVELSPIASVPAIATRFTDLLEDILSILLQTA